MAIKFSILGLLIYAAMALWVLSAGGYALRRPRTGDWLFASGFPVLVAAFIMRWIEVEHAPLQNMFEVFVCLGMLTYPLWCFAHRFLGARGPAINVVLGLIVLFPAGFVFHAEPQRLPPALQSWLFIPHVTSYMVAYMILMMAGGQAALQLAGLGGNKEPDRLEASTYRLVLFGFPLLTGGLALGALWGKLAWGDWWNWDPKELWSLTTFLAFLGYLHVRSQYGARHPILTSVLAIVGCAAIVITLLWVNLSRMFPGMHSYAN